MVLVRARPPHSAGRTPHLLRILQRTVQLVQGLVGVEPPRVRLRHRSSRGSERQSVLLRAAGGAAPLHRASRLQHLQAAMQRASRSRSLPAPALTFMYVGSSSMAAVQARRASAWSPRPMSQAARLARYTARCLEASGGGGAAGRAHRRARAARQEALGSRRGGERAVARSRMPCRCCQACAGVQHSALCAARARARPRTLWLPRTCFDGVRVLLRCCCVVLLRVQRVALCLQRLSRGQHGRLLLFAQRGRVRAAAARAALGWLRRRVRGLLLRGGGCGCGCGISCGGRAGGGRGCGGRAAGRGWRRLRARRRRALLQLLHHAHHHGTLLAHARSCTGELLQLLRAR